MRNRHCLAGLLCALLVGCEVETGAPPAASAPPAPAEPLVIVKHDVQRVARGALRFVAGFREGYEQSQREGKPMLLFFTAEWCHYCHQMADEAFTDPQVVNLSERFVCILIDADSEQDVCRQFRVTAFPTLQFLSPRGIAMNRLEGKRPGHQVTIAMQSALQNVARRNTSPGAPQR